ncbi:DUF5615 family PIN-like protein [Microcoleus sp. ARI1-B5]|uniref:DUF5615 family PIN-like protein n=1 Tax=unclassified Microcoleus TaxID=2642155 RepID=UPI002FD76809
MKLILDECIDRRLAKEFVGYEVKTVPQMGWAGIKNGQLLALVEAEFDVFITVDRNCHFSKICHSLTLPWLFGKHPLTAWQI